MIHDYPDKMKALLLPFVCALIICSCQHSGRSHTQSVALSTEDQIHSGTKSTSSEEKWFYELEAAKSTPDLVVNLSLREGGFTSFPDEIFGFRNLESLDLSMNELNFLPEKLGQLQKLQHLNLSYCNLDSLPTSITSLSSLESLELLSNKISHIPKEIGNLQNLTVLGVTDNPISEFPLSIYSLKHLRLLSFGQKDTLPRISADQIGQVRKEIPTCKLIF